MATISSIADLYDKSGENHSNTKVMSLIVIVGELTLWGALKFAGKDITWPDVFLLISLVVAAQSVRALLAFWRARFNGHNGNGGATSAK